MSEITFPTPKQTPKNSPNRTGIPISYLIGVFPGCMIFRNKTICEIIKKLSPAPKFTLGMSFERYLPPTNPLLNLRQLNAFVVSSNKGGPNFSFDFDSALSSTQLRPVASCLGFFGTG